MAQAPVLISFEFQNFQTKLDGSDRLIIQDSDYDSDSTRITQKDPYNNRWEIRLGPDHQRGSPYFNLYLKKIGDGDVIALPTIIIRDSHGKVVFERVFTTDRDDKRASPMKFNSRCSAEFKHLAICFVKKHAILSYGTLCIDLWLQYKPITSDNLSYKPANPLNDNMLNLLDSGMHADGWFKVNGHVFPVHLLILQANVQANEQVDFCPTGSTLEDPLVIEGVSVKIFKIVLRYIYGADLDQVVPDMGEVELVLKEGKAIVMAADKFGITSLKLAAEAVLVQNLAMESCNIADWLIFAHDQNCFLLKEMAMSHAVTRATDIWDDIPESLHKELIAAMSTVIRAATRFDANRMGEGIHSLRSKLYKRGLDMDGSKDTLLTRLDGWNQKRARVDEEFLEAAVHEESDEEIEAAGREPFSDIEIQAPADDEESDGFVFRMRSARGSSS